MNEISELVIIFLGYNRLKKLQLKTFNHIIIFLAAAFKGFYTSLSYSNIGVNKDAIDLMKLKNITKSILT